ncbi:MAG: hypothetical protein JNM71_05110 [Flavobacterium lindanitolerans]|uniref:hypothetical protein n=1 Tax=Flavobacterium lindanitolerans TaxID=428988 RepID=UPI001A514109|nr:hypothetical protein [Flavobacterium lindanitolerans]MBL7867377.1 hypothetical protein [Flavobacterium lindanitolerans]
MAEIMRNRKIRPSTRKDTSINYRVDIAKVLKGDTLIVNITHENLPFKKTFYFDGNEIANKNNISFRVSSISDQIEIVWSGAKPTREI